MTGEIPAYAGMTWALAMTIMRSMTNPIDTPTNIFHTFLMTNHEWIEKLAKDELRVENSGEFDLYGSFDQTTILKEQTSHFLRELRQITQEMANTFNAYRGEKNSIKVFQITGTEADFMIFRNSLKLVFAARKPGEISINFLTVRNGILEEARGKESTKDGDALKATVGPFNEAHWYFRDHCVDPKSLMKFYFTEFVKNSLL
ncbi:MAG: hypothetical protein A3F16_03505 [Deltaproteobacteria bacterium RIFCSPHIGHO2_12_FULL_43_9]|nr:MAG: hypothetical protein A3F16_03505 [Deltaproteobacteria bacterium RIFCSPHIGHO2_12_FULL_43_9]